MTADTVAEAVATSGREQPHAALGLTDAEYASIAAQLGRQAHGLRTGHLLGDVERALLI